MTNATEEFRALLDGRGVKWKAGIEGVTFAGDWCFVEYDNGKLAATCEPVLTPVQAIAATFGERRDRTKELLIEACNRAERDYIAELERKLEAAALGSGECELASFADVRFNVEYEVDGYDVDSGADYATLAECSSCGAYVIVPPVHHHVLTCDGSEVFSEYAYCPVCGKAVKR